MCKKWAAFDSAKKGQLAGHLREQLASYGYDQDPGGVWVKG
jgi:hypothetical protein